MPAANIMAIQLTVENSGFSSSPPSRMWPNFDIAMKNTKKTNTVAARTNSQPPLETTQSRAFPETLAKLSGAMRPQARTASTASAAGTVTAQSMPDVSPLSDGLSGTVASVIWGGGSTAPSATPAASASRPVSARAPSGPWGWTFSVFPGFGSEVVIQPGCNALTCNFKRGSPVNKVHLRFFRRTVGAGGCINAVQPL